MAPSSRLLPPPIPPETEEKFSRLEEVGDIDRTIPVKDGRKHHSASLLRSDSADQLPIPKKRKGHLDARRALRLPRPRLRARRRRPWHQDGLTLTIVGMGSVIALGALTFLVFRVIF